jgi:hypothetical protein
MLVSHAHIDAILTGYKEYADEFTVLSAETLTNIGQTLLFGNLCGYATCTDQELPDEDDPPEYVSSYQYRECPLHQLGALLKFCDFLKYQSCNAEDWDHSEACIELGNMCSTFTKALPGYEQAPWHYEGEEAC